MLLVATAVMVALGEAGKAALRAFFGTKRGTRQLIENSQEKLVEYFAGKGVGQRQLPLEKPPPDDLSSWVDEWKEYAASAGITDTADINNVGRWINSNEVDGRAGRSGKAAAVADALLRRGKDVDRADELAIASALLDVEKGESEAQCRSVDVIWIVMTGQSPGEEDRAWFEAQRSSKIAVKEGEDPRVDVRLAKGYYKQHKETSVMTLERALLKDRT